jgi:hypothetical protein
MLLPRTPWRHGATISKSQLIGPVSAIHALHSNRLQRKGNINSRIPSSRGSFLLRSITTHAAKDAMTTSSVLRTDSYLTSNVKDLMSLQDRVVVITGGAKGIGLALAFGVAEAGGKIAIVDASSQPSENYARLQKICSEVRYYQ